MNIFHINLQGLFCFSLFYIKMCRFIENQDLLRRVVGAHGDRKIKSHWPKLTQTNSKTQKTQCKLLKKVFLKFLLEQKN